MKANLILRASAGTGKTFSLATRFIRLAVFENTPPDRIVALTFSRLAAREIYDKIVERLCAASASEEGAAAERRHLVDGLSAADAAAVEKAAPRWSRADFARLLRRVIETRHCGGISTIDGFILRVVRSFPLEMGFQSAVSVLDEHGEQRAMKDAGESALSGRRSADFENAFLSMAGGAPPRSCSRALEAMLSLWWPFFTYNRQSADWTAETMAGAIGAPPAGEFPDLSAIPRDGGRNDPREKFADYVRSFRPGDPVFRNAPGEMAEYICRNPAAVGYERQTARGTVRWELGPEGAAAVRSAVRYMAGANLRMRLAAVAAKLRICALVDAEYDASTRRRGLLSFRDFADKGAGGGAGASPELENLRFRFDSRFDHWALDEFQDTSVLQWEFLRGLFREAASGGGRSAMAVGDLKQSIYVWRGGNDAPFKDIMHWPEFGGEYGEIKPLAESRRYGSNTARFINSVFGPENLRASCPRGPASAGAEKWLADDCWQKHEALHDRDCVELVSVDSAPGAGDEAADEDGPGVSAAMRVLAPAAVSRAAELWRAREEAGSGETIGVLVRRNADGAYIAECLRREGLPAVWEGESAALDSPVAAAVMQLLKLAAHPQDTMAWKTVDSLLPVRRIAFPQITHASALSAEISRMLSRQGLARTVSHIASALSAPEHGLDGWSAGRLDALARKAAEFEAKRGAAPVSEFEEFLEQSPDRDAAASAGSIRVLTIHRAKGLTLDRAIVPVCEPWRGPGSGLDDIRPGTILRGEKWVLDGADKGLCAAFPEIDAAKNAAVAEHCLETLRNWYVALTRAKRHTCVFVASEAAANDKTFSSILAAPFLAGEGGERAGGGRLLHVSGRPPAFEARGDAGGAESGAWKHVAPAKTVERRSPSAAAGEAPAPGARRGEGENPFAARETAAARGIAAHEALASIEWIDPSAPRDETEKAILGSEWREAFVRPGGDSLLWREQAYEVLADGVWESGRFDRVVFSGPPERRTAAIYDFKTNLPRPGEDGEAFARRMSGTYGPQMHAYRKSLSLLTGIPPGRISAKLLLTSPLRALNPRA